VSGWAGCRTTAASRKRTPHSTAPPASSPPTRAPRRRPSRTGLLTLAPAALT